MRLRGSSCELRSVVSSSLASLKLYSRRACSSDKLFKVLPCTTSGLYTTPPLDPNIIDLSKFLAISHKVFNLPSKYLAPVDFNYKLPSTNTPEFAFIGRSNVGKSSLISALLSNKTLVRVSKEPGCTKTINYYGFLRRGKQTAPALYLIDLPGYGFARVSKVDKERFSMTTEAFFKSRNFTVLRRVYVLVDCRHGLRQSDRDIMDQLNAANITYQIVLTKADLCTADTVDSSLTSVLRDLMEAPTRHLSVPIVHVLSSRSGQGVQTLKQSICEMLCQNIVGNQATGAGAFEDLDEETLMQSIRELGLD